MNALSVARTAHAGITAAREEAERNLTAFEAEHAETLRRHVEMQRILHSAKQAETATQKIVTDLQFDHDWHKLPIMQEG